ncbi:MAG: hypothetical protein E6J88_06975, partial [Deltaproteobacteria bacterium]
MDFDRDFGVNQVFVEDQYERWRQNPAAVDEEWQKYFARMHGLPFPSAPAFQASAWSQPSAPVIPVAGNGDNGHFAGALLDIAAPEIERLKAEELQERVAELINAYRIRGHLFANLDPLGMLQPPPPELDPEHFGLSEGDLDKTFVTGDFGAGELTLREIIARLKHTYCRTIGVEYMHGEDPAIKKWLQEKMESTGNEPDLTREQKLRILARLTDAETLETFLHRKYIGKKRFSLEGGESLIPLLDWLLDEFEKLQGEELVLGMAHRGRLNVLVNVLGKGLNELFAEFEDQEVETMMGRGDVKYHMGYSTDRGNLHLSLAFNPSHLEIVDPVVEGRVRAKQDRNLNWAGAPAVRDPERRKVLPVLIHGDAAMAGQGIIAEVLNLSNLEGYATGGTVHVVINNQVGFTTNAEDARSTPYATDIARVLRAPVFHVNGEDPEAVVWAVQLAVEYRQTFKQDVLIDLYCYRKYGHNEGDEPAFTQPRMYEIIRQKEPPRQVYARRLAEEGVATGSEADDLMRRRVAKLEEELERTRKEGAKRASVSAMAGLWSHDRGGPDSLTPEVPTNVPVEKLRSLLTALSQVPEGFTPNDKIAKLLEGRRKLAEGATTELADPLLRPGRAARDVLPSPRGAGRRARRQALYAARASAAGTGPVRHLRLSFERSRRDGVRLRLVARHARGTDVLGSAVRRLRQWRAGGNRSVHFVSRGQVEPPLRNGALVAARLRRAGPGALLGAARALPAALRGRQHAGLLSDHPGADLSFAAPANTARVAKAADRDDAEVLAAPQARGFDTRRSLEGRVPPSHLGPRGQTGEARPLVQRQGLLRPARRPRS